MNRTASKERKRGKKPTTYRRVVTGNANGKSVVQSDEPLLAYQFDTVPGYEHTLVWINPAIPDLSNEQRFDRYPDSVVPGPGGTSLHFVTFPPGSVFADPSFDADASQQEALVRLRGLADHFEKEDPGMHKTNTVDYAVVYDGEMAGVGRRRDSAFEPRRRRRAKRYAPRMAKQRHQARHNALFLERSTSS